MQSSDKSGEDKISVPVSKDEFLSKTKGTLQEIAASSHHFDRSPSLTSDTDSRSSADSINERPESTSPPSPTYKDYCDQRRAMRRDMMTGQIKIKFDKVLIKQFDGLREQVLDQFGDIVVLAETRHALREYATKVEQHLNESRKRYQAIRMKCQSMTEHVKAELQHDATDETTWTDVLLVPTPQNLPREAPQQGLQPAEFALLFTLFAYLCEVWIGYA